MSWQPGPNAQRYNIQLGLTLTTLATVATGVTGTSYSFAGLSPSTTYVGAVVPVCASGTGIQFVSSPFTTSSANSPCLGAVPPAGLNAGLISSNGAQLNWSPVANISSYTVEYRPAAALAWIPAGNTAQTFYSLTGLTPGTAYKWRVKGSCAGNTTGYTSASFVTLSNCAAPVSISSSVTAGSVSLSWESITGAINYSVEYRVAGSTGWTLFSSTLSTTSATITGLTPSTTYDYRLRVICGSGWGPYGTIRQFTTSLPCNAPTGLYSGNITTSTAAVGWGVTPFITTTIIEYKPSTALTWNAAGTTTGSFYNITGLAAGTLYDWRVQTVCGGGNSTFVQAQFTTQANAVICNAPAGLSSAATAADWAKVSWAAVSGALNYTVEYQPAGAANWTSAAANTAAASGTITGLAASTTYNWRVRTNCTGGSSAYTQAQFTTLAAAAPCNAPSLSAPLVSSSLATVSWAAVSGALSYDVEYKPASSTTWISVVQATTNLSVNISGLTASSAYDYRVRSNCSSGSSGYTQTQFNTGSASCNSPSGLNSSGVSNTSVTVGWDAVSGASNYEVHYKPVSVTNWGLAAIITVPTNTANISGLTGATVYDWRVRTLCPAGGSSNYVIAQFSTSAATCTAPSNLTVSGTSSSGTTLNWTAVSRALSYDIDYKLGSSANWVSAVTATPGSSVSISGLTASTAYDWRVRTNCASGSSGYVQAQFTTNSQAAGCVNAYEPNELQGTAASITVNLPVSASIGSSIDIDYYSFVVSSNSSLNITLSNVPATQDYDLYLYNVSGTVIGSSTAGPGASETIALANQQAGTYYIRVAGYNGAFNTTLCYTLNAGVTPAGGVSCTVPSGLSSSAITSNSAAVSWLAVSGALNYTMEYKPSASANWITAQPNTTSTSATLSGLSLSTLYDWRVRTNCSGGNSTYAQAQFGTLGTSACTAPTGLTVAAISNTGASLSWAPVSGAVSYDMDYKLSTSTNWINNFVNITSTTVPLAGLNPSTLYDWRVRTNCSGGSSVYGQSQLTTTAAGVSCAAPAGLTVSGISSSGATVGWTPVSNFWYYKIEYKKTNETSWIFANYSTSSSLSLTGLSASTAYDWRISTTCLDGSSSAAAQSQFTTTGGTQTRIASTDGTAPKSTEQTAKLKTGITLYPNPVGDRLTIISTDAIRTVRLVSVSGQMLGMHNGMNKLTMELPVARLVQGVYLVQVTTRNGQTSVHKMMKN